MSVAYSAASRETTGRSGENYRDPTESSENLSEPESKASETKPSARSGSGKATTSKRASKRTPAASKPLFSLDQLTVTDADELRRLMHESLKGFVEGIRCRDGRAGGCKSAGRGCLEALRKEESA